MPFKEKADRIPEPEFQIPEYRIITPENGTKYRQCLKMQSEENAKAACQAGGIPVICRQTAATAFAQIHGKKRTKIQ